MNIDKLIKDIEEEIKMHSYIAEEYLNGCTKGDPYSKGNAQGRLEVIQDLQKILEKYK